jgi:hypothetical protein
MKIMQDEKGSALLLSILMIGLLAVIGIFSTQTSTTETRIARNQKLHKMAFHEAEGGAEVGIQILEDNIEEKGFDDRVSGGSCEIRNVAIDTADTDPRQSSVRLYMKDALPSTGANAKPGWANDVRDATIPRNSTGVPPLTNIMIGRSGCVATPGSSLQMIAGYEGKGKSAAGGGTYVIYDVRSRHQGLDNSESTINLGWLHVN